MSGGKGYLSAVVADASRPLHASSIFFATVFQQRAPQATAARQSESSEPSASSSNEHHDEMPSRSNFQSEKDRQSVPNSPRHIQDNTLADIQDSAQYQTAPIDAFDNQYGGVNSMLDSAPAANVDARTFADDIVQKKPDSTTTPQKQHTKTITRNSHEAPQTIAKYSSNKNMQRNKNIPKQQNDNTDSSLENISHEHSTIINQAASHAAENLLPEALTNPQIADNIHQQESQPAHQGGMLAVFQAQKHETGFDEPPRANREERTNHANGSESIDARPQVHIGQVDVLIVSETKAPTKLLSPPTSGDFSSRNYLRRL